MRVNHTVRATRAARVAESVEAAARATGSQPPMIATGLVLADLDFNVLYANSAAVQILSCSDSMRRSVSHSPASVQQQIRSIFGAERFAAQIPPAAFRSGPRRYVLRPFLLDWGDRPPLVALVLDGPPRDTPDLSSVGELFHLSPRERETVRYLVDGLTTKEVAQRMQVSPNTIKQFVRLIMSKMGVTTRTGIIGKLVGR